MHPSDWVMVLKPDLFVPLISVKKYHCVTIKVCSILYTLFLVLLSISVRHFDVFSEASPVKYRLHSTWYSAIFEPPFQIPPNFRDSDLRIISVRWLYLTFLRPYFQVIQLNHSIFVDPLLYSIVSALLIIDSAHLKFTMTMFGISSNHNSHYNYKHP